MTTPTDTLIRATAKLERAALTDSDPTDAIVLGCSVLDVRQPARGRVAAKRHIAWAGFLRAWAVHEPSDRAEALIKRAEGEDLLAGLALIATPRTDA